MKIVVFKMPKVLSGIVKSVLKMNWNVEVLHTKSQNMT